MTKTTALVDKVSRLQKTYKVTGMDCDSCAKMIELDLEDVGIKASCDFVNCRLTVDYSVTTFEEKIIHATLSKSGYKIEEST